MAEEKKVNGKPEPENEEKKDEKKEKSIMKQVGEVVDSVKPKVGKGLKFLGKVVIGTMTVMSTIAAVAAIATPKKKYFSPIQNPNGLPGQDDVTGNSETVYHGEVQDV